MPFEVVFTAQAEADIEDIHRFIADRGEGLNADRVAAGIEDACRSLTVMPERGNIPKELAAIGIRTYRETRFKPYRIIYQVADSIVVVHAVLDGRRDMQSLLLRRLTR
jgi:toxin ParE1/3/4